MNRNLRLASGAAILALLAACAEAPPSDPAAMEALKRDAMAKKMALQNGGQLNVGANGEVEAAEPLVICAPPLQDPDGGTRELDVNFSRVGLRSVGSPTATQGCDLMLQFTQHSGDTEFRYELTSAYSATSQASGQVTNWWGVNDMVSKLVNELSVRFAPGTPGGQALALERRHATGVGHRAKHYASAERLAQVNAAAQEGDAALAAGDRRGAFAAYTRALSGPWSDDDTSERLRDAYLKLVGQHPDLAPPVPEEARRHMVRGKAILKDSSDFASYDSALGEMVQAAIVAPWWGDVYFNAAVVAEKAGYLQDAMNGYRHYILANPHAPDARSVQDKIYALEVRAERGGKP